MKSSEMLKSTNAENTWTLQTPMNDFKILEFKHFENVKQHKKPMKTFKLLKLEHLESKQAHETDKSLEDCEIWKYKND